MHKSTIQLKTTVLRVLTIAIALAMPQISASADDPRDGARRIAAADLDHGRKLYEVSCEACHTANVHWRDRGLVDSWPTLLQQVNLWQRISSLRWDPADLNDVAAYLNDRFYHFPCPADECRQGGCPASQGALAELGGSCDGYGDRGDY